MKVFESKEPITKDQFLTSIGVKESDVKLTIQDIHIPRDGYRWVYDRTMYIVQYK